MRLRYDNVDHTEVVDDENGSTIAWDPEKDQPADMEGVVGDVWDKAGRPKPAPYDAI
jgi:hypothetical protein